VTEPSPRRAEVAAFQVTGHDRGLTTQRTATQHGPRGSGDQGRACPRPPPGRSRERGTGHDGNAGGDEGVRGPGAARRSVEAPLHGRGRLPEAGDGVEAAGVTEDGVQRVPGQDAGGVGCHRGSPCSFHPHHPSESFPLVRCTTLRGGFRSHAALTCRRRAVAGRMDQAPVRPACRPPARHRGRRPAVFCPPGRSAHVAGQACPHRCSGDRTVGRADGRRPSATVRCLGAPTGHEDAPRVVRSRPRLGTGRRRVPVRRRPVGCCPQAPRRLAEGRGPFPRMPMPMWEGDSSAGGRRPHRRLHRSFKGCPVAAARGAGSDDRVPAARPPTGDERLCRPGGCDHRGPTRTGRSPALDPQRRAPGCQPSNHSPAWPVGGGRGGRRAPDRRA
jgi:hypothetical protein